MGKARLHPNSPSEGVKKIKIKIEDKYQDLDPMLTIRECGIENFAP